MTIAIIGITGLIGRRVAALARRRGHQVIGFTRNPPPNSPDTRLFPNSALPDFTGCHAILNLAGQSVATLWTPSRRRAIRDSRIHTTRRIVQAIRATTPPPRVLVNASAVGIYADTADTPATESAPQAATFLAQVCQSWESEALLARDTGTRVVLLRTGVVLSPEGGALAAMLPAFRLGLGGNLGSGRQWFPWIHIEDHAALALFALETQLVSGPLNATAPAPVRNADFTQALAATLRRPAFFTVPSFLLHAALDGFATELLASRRILPAAATAQAFPFRHPEIRPALEHLLKK